MIEQGFRIRAARGPFTDQIDILLATFDAEGKRLLFEETPGGNLCRVDPSARRVGEPIPPSLALVADAAQQLMDDLWQAGLRPTQGRQSEGQLAAMAAHLLDMRTIAFNSLHLENPK